MRILGIDYGTKRIGLAVCDALEITVNPISIVHRKNEAVDIEEVVKAAREKEAEKIVVGLPLNMDGTPGVLTEEIKKFSQKIETVSGLPVEFCDESLTSHEADNILINNADMSREKRKTIKDKISACLILRNYLDRTLERQTTKKDQGK